VSHDKNKDKPKERVRIIVEKCTGCGLCVKVCPFSAIQLKNKKAIIDYDRCTMCGACQESCRFKAIDIIDVSAGAVKIVDISLYKDVWVFCEQRKGVIQSVSYELLGEGKKLAHKLGSKLCAVLLGDKMEAGVNELYERGADIVYLVDSPKLMHYQDEPYSRIQMCL
jgi:Pyruvate/2-oxoacid:ferredoxin oxidoreductase delta subunit